jgi:general secretion pathway protein A
MYKAHFKLNSIPFSATTTPENTYQSPELTEALSHFSFAIENRDSILLLTGEVGSGKTTAVQAGLRRFRQNMAVAVVSHATLTPRELLESVAAAYNLQTEKRETKPQLIRRLEAHFSRCRDSGRPALLIFDEAHLLKPAVVEEIRLLSNLNRQGENLVQIFLVGQPELEKRLQRRNRSLRQRISVRYRLKPLTREETSKYIAYRLRAAGCSKPFEVFSTEAVAAIHRLSGGLPREINVIAGYAMLTCFVADQHQVTMEHVRSVMTEYGFQSVTEPPEEEELVAEPPRTKVLESLDDAPLATEEKPISVQPGENGEEQSPWIFQAATSHALGSIRKLSSSETVVAVIGLVVAAVFIAWILLKPAPAGEKTRPSADSMAAAQSKEPSTEATPRDVGTDESVAEATSEEPTPPNEPAPQPEGEALPVIKLDTGLADYPNQPVTVQIASLIDPERAERSLALVSEQTDIPGAIQIVSGEETTWYLVLLGYFNNAEKAEAAIQPILPLLQDQEVAEVRIKRAPSWLQTRLSEPAGN